MDDTTEAGAAQGIVPMPTNPRFENLTGMRFGRLTVLGYAGKKGVRHQWFTKCDCGTSKPIDGADMKAGKTTSCRCHHRERAAAGSYVHGRTRTKVHTAWVMMNQRCANPNMTSYPDYGGRGIRVCDRWRTSFDAFYEDMGDLPFVGAELDRFPDTNGNYEPGNVRWATRAEQMRNTRRNRMLDFRGERLCMQDWAARVGLRPMTLQGRLNAGWSVEDALTIPVGARR